MYVSYFRSPWRRTLLTSMWCTSQCLDAATAKLVLCNPSLLPVQRSHDSPLLGLGRTLLKPAMIFSCSLCHLHQNFPDIPTCTEQVSSQVEGKLAPKLHFFGESWTLHSLHLSISDISEHGSMTLDQNNNQIVGLRKQGIMTRNNNTFSIRIWPGFS